ncbi:DUF805 domain-containing protein [Pseudoxanthomonas dokdonensis]|uniref:Membrane protein n=1 Tax=Pseudoxanthomonas dokdonensis TaxID=344882 RepID=A0A0R0CIF5_9GAMM|nr:DUF805 domain-containing protein [Pseudoxanthomonas dokdonensis]KRG68982.1 membrane protein [Pseudoxanthomonas dokdonensis]
MEWMVLPLRRYADFSGRSRRSEFWMFQLFYLLVLIVLGMMIAIGAVVSDKPPGLLGNLALGLVMLFALAMAVPMLALQVRRFHDQDKSGWMVLCAMIPFIGGIMVLVFMCMEGTRGPNRFGPDPKGSQQAV